MDKQKKTFLIGGIVEGAILLFDLIISILVWTTIVSEETFKASGYSDYAKLNLDTNGPFLAFFQNNPTAFFCIICIPLFAIIALDFVYFAILASKKESKLSEAQLDAIRAKAKQQAQEELMREMEAEMAAEKEEPKKNDEPNNP